MLSLPTKLFYEVIPKLVYSRRTHGALRDRPALKTLKTAPVDVVAVT